MSESEKVETAEPAVDPTPAPQPDDTAAAPAPSKPAAPPRRRGGGVFLALLLGGALTAGGGFALARYVPDGWPLADPPGLIAAQESLASQQAVLDDLQTRLAALEAAPAAADPTALLQEFEARLLALESRPAGDADALNALKTELETLRAVVTAPTAQMQAEAEARLADAKAQAKALRDEAEAAAAAARRAAAIATLRAAFEAGLPMAPALETAAAAGITVPAELQSDPAPLPALQAGFPDAARQALADVRAADPGTDLGSRLTNFLAAQTGARSIAPQAGDGPDAILSRAEAALAAGDLDTALAELQALPAAALPALETWLAAARHRQAAAAALAHLN